MRYVKLLLACALSLVLVAALAIRVTQPLRDLQGDQISQATVLLSAPHREIEVRDTQALAELLQGLVLYRRDDSWRSFDGQRLTYTLTKTDGKRLVVTVCWAPSPFIVLNGVGYRCRPAQCRALCRYPSTLLSPG